MGLLLWPLAVLAVLVWSLAAWLVYTMSDWAAGLLAGALGGVLSAELGPWAAWVLASLGGIIQVVVIITWALVSLIILASPLLLGRARQRGWVPEGRRDDGGRGFYAAADRMVRGDDDRCSDDRWRRTDAARDAERPRAPGRSVWGEQMARGTRDLSDLRAYAGYLAGDMAKKYRKKKKKKREDWDDD